MIKEYYLKDGSKRYLFKAYLGVDPLTGKKKYTTRRNFKTSRDAKIALARLKVQVEENGIAEKQQKMKFEDVAKMWLESYEKTVKPSTFHSQSLVLQNHVLPYFKGKWIDKITMIHCQKYVNQQSDILVRYNNSVNMAYRIFQYAVHLKVIKDNPIANTIRPKRKEQEQKYNYWNKEQLQSFLDQLDKSDYDNTLKLLFRLLSYTGMRKSECLALRWSDVDFQKGLISINRSLAYSKTGYQFQTPKTKSSQRTIAVDTDTIKKLQRYHLEQRQMLFANCLKSQGKDQLIFANEFNQHYHSDYPNHFLDKMIPQFDLPKITVHGLRHSHCSLLFESGATIKEVQDRLGHTDIKTTMDIYTHVTEKQRELTADKFAEYLAKL